MSATKRPWLPTDRSGRISLVALALAVLLFAVSTIINFALGWVLALYAVHYLAALVAFATSVHGPYRNKAKPLLVFLSLFLSGAFLLVPIIVFVIVIVTLSLNPIHLWEGGL